MVGDPRPLRGQPINPIADVEVSRFNPLNRLAMSVSCAQGQGMRVIVGPGEGVIALVPAAGVAVGVGIGG